VCVVCVRVCGVCVVCVCVCGVCGVCVVCACVSWNIKEITLSLRSSLYVNDQVSLPYKTSRIIILYILINLLHPKTYFMYRQFNIQQFYALPTLYLCVLYLSENKQRLFLFRALTFRFL